MQRFLQWREAIAVADDEEAVCALVTECVNGVLPSDIASLPPACQQILENPARDVQGAAVVLLQQELCFSGDFEVAALLHEIAHTFVAASSRLGRLHARGSNATTPQDERA
jgi:hypothetical protein